MRKILVSITMVGAAVANNGMAQTIASSAAPVTETVAAAPVASHPGIYVATNGADPAGFVRLDGVRADLSEKTKMSFSFDVTNTALAVKATLPGTASAVKLQKRMPTFYFDLTGTTPGTVATPRFANLAGKPFKSPFEFRLVRFTIKGGTRVADLGRISLMGGTGSGNSKTQIPFASTAVSPGIFRVWSQMELTPGAYGFVSVKPRDQQDFGEDGVSSDVYDFTVE